MMCRCTVLLMMLGLALAPACSPRIKGPNLEPVALAGPDHMVMTGVRVILDGARSYDPEGSVLTYFWLVVARPDDARAVLSYADTVSVGLMPDSAGAWIVRLTVTDDQGASASDVIRVMVEDRPCQSDLDCADLNQCTRGRCQNQVCVFVSPDGAACDDGLFCTESDACVDRQCLGVARNCLPVENQCNTGYCDEDLDSCLLVPVRDGTACDDDQFCTIGDLCLSGVCLGAEMDCSGSAGECQRAFCDEEQDRCLAEPASDGSMCDDGQWCTVDDACSGGTCRGASRDCSGDYRPCRVGICDEDQNACVEQARPATTLCDDGVYCNGTDFCDGLGECAVHSGDPCANGDECNRQCQELPMTCFDYAGTACGDQTSTGCSLPDSCDGQGHCRPNHLQDGTPCQDDLACSVAETCQAGTCTGVPRDCSQIQLSDCQVGVCDESQGGCTAQPLPDGSDCDDGLVCSAGDSCQAGACASGSGLNCDDGDSCTVDSCSEEQGGCQHILMPVPGAEGPAYKPNCSNGEDDDCDGLVDQADPDCDCIPQCLMRECGNDGCGGQCEPGCQGNEHCSVFGQCVWGPGGGWAFIEAGSFEMGSPSNEPGRGYNETRHSVTLTRDFLIGTTEVTREQFEGLMGYVPQAEECSGDDCPVTSVRWYQAVLYVNALSLAAGRAPCYTCQGTDGYMLCQPSSAYDDPYQCPGYRLPTEAEWEYAARAGTSASTYNGQLDNSQLNCEQPNPVLDSIAWFCGNSDDDYIRQVASLAPNQFGLYDMLGNVAEWCHDGYADDYGGMSNSDDTTDPAGDSGANCQVIKGGCGEFQAYRSRSASRMPIWYGDSYRWLGFRPVRTVSSE